MAIHPNLLAVQEHLSGVAYPASRATWSPRRRTAVPPM